MGRRRATATSSSLYALAAMVRIAISSAAFATSAMLHPAFAFAPGCRFEPKVAVRDE